MRILHERIIEGNVRYIKAAGNSSETPPTENIATGSQFAVADAGELLMFDETSGEWHTYAKFDTGAAASNGAGLGGLLGGNTGGNNEPEEPAEGDGE